MQKGSESKVSCRSSIIVRAEMAKQVLSLVYILVRCEGNLAMDCPSWFSVLESLSLPPYVIAC